MILTAEGAAGVGDHAARRARSSRRSSPPRAPSRPRSWPPRPSGSRGSCARRASAPRSYLQAQGQAKAIEKVFAAIKAGKPTPELLAYQYLQTLPQMARARPTRCGWCPATSARRWRGSPGCWARPARTACSATHPSPATTDPAQAREDSDEVADWFDTTDRPGDRRGGRRGRGRGATNRRPRHRSAAGIPATVQQTSSRCRPQQHRGTAPSRSEVGVR